MFWSVLIIENSYTILSENSTYQKIQNTNVIRTYTCNILSINLIN